MPEFRRIGVGLVGVGAIGRFHAENLAFRIPRAQLVALADAFVEPAKKVAANLYVDNVYSDFNGLIDDTVLVQITGTRHGIAGTEVGIDPAQETGSGLKKVSYVSCTNILTREQALIDQTLR